MTNSLRRAMEQKALRGGGSTTRRGGGSTTSRGGGSPRVGEEGLPRGGVILGPSGTRGFWSKIVENWSLSGPSVTGNRRKFCVVKPPIPHAWDPPPHARGPPFPHAWGTPLPFWHLFFFRLPHTPPCATWYFFWTSHYITPPHARHWTFFSNALQIWPQKGPLGPFWRSNLCPARPRHPG